ALGGILRRCARILAVAVAIAALGCTSTQLMPTTFESDRIFANATAPDGRPVVFFTDSGGGYNAVASSIAARYSLESKGEVQSDGRVTALVGFPEFLTDSGIPRPNPDRWLGGNLAVVPDERLEADGFLGSRWFAGRVWVFDYTAKTLALADSSSPYAAWIMTPLGFRSDQLGSRDLNFPRISIEVSGESLEMLLDTGATALVTEESAPVLKARAGERVGTSYIVRSVFERWQSRNPNWRVIAAGDAVLGRPMPMIEVPEIAISGVRFGPVWFTQRPDANFREWMSQMTDKTLDGAIGGSALRHLRFVLDYPAGEMYLQRND
ncbi:MAG: hypothetical protein AAFQ99_10435, partial [Pseudomonadota bacterium]